MSLTLVRYVVLAFFVGIVVGYLTFHLPQADATRTQRRVDPHELVEKLSAYAHSSRLYYVEDWAGNIFLSQEARPLSQLWSLAHDGQNAAGWKGVVHAWKLPAGFSAYTSDCGDSGRQIGDWLLFGDPILVHRLGDMLMQDCTG